MMTSDTKLNNGIAEEDILKTTKSNIDKGVGK